MIVFHFLLTNFIFFFFTLQCDPKHVDHVILNLSWRRADPLDGIVVIP